MIALVLAAAIATPAPASVELDPIAIVGAQIFTEAGPPIDGGTVLFQGGRIVAVGKDVALPPRTKKVDGTGKIVTPGFVDASTHLGLIEIDAVQTTNEYALSDGGAIHAAFRAADGLDPAATQIAVNRMEGITTAVADPEGALVSGQSAMIHLDGARVAEMLVQAPLAIDAYFGEAARGYGGNTRGGALRKLREAFDDARLLGTKLPAEEENRLRSLSAPRLDLLALKPVLDRTIPLVVVAHKAADIELALAFAREQKIRLVIRGGAEAWKVAGDLAAAKVPVLVDPFQNLPGSFETLGSRYDDAALLDRAGVTIALTGGSYGMSDAPNARILRQEAGNAVAWGLPHDAALADVTRVPAEIFGVADRIGTIAPGKAADLVLWSGDPFESSSEAEKVFISGREIPRHSRQTELLDRYRTLPGKR